MSKRVKFVLHKSSNGSSSSSSNSNSDTSDTTGVLGKIQAAQHDRERDKLAQIAQTKLDSVVRGLGLLTTDELATFYVAIAWAIDEQPELLTRMLEVIQARIGEERCALAWDKLKADTQQPVKLKQALTNMLPDDHARRVGRG